MDTIDRKTFMNLLWRYKRGSIAEAFSRTSGLGLATAVMAQAMPWLVAPKRAHAAGNIGDRVVIATWPNYHDMSNFDTFAQQTGAKPQVNVFGSNEEMLAKLQAGGTGWDVFVPTITRSRLCLARSDRTAGSLQAVQL
jgi:spermidine/putrescine transport system substrate-binding protein